MLETESRIAIESALPSRWIYRRDASDYGIDAEVEIVGPDGQVSGDRFFVQLKATDATDVSEALKITLKRSAANYYRRLTIPVLIVRYHAPTRTLYARWYHDLNLPEPTRQSRKPKTRSAAGKGTVTLRLEEADRWGPDTSLEIARAVSLWRWIKSPALALPVKMRLVIGIPEFSGQPSSELARATESLARRIPGVLEISEVPTGVIHGTVRVGREKADIDLPAGFAATIKAEPGASRLVPPTEFAADLLLAVAIALGDAGHADVGSRIASAVAIDSGIIRNEPGASLVAKTLGNAGQFATLLRLASELVEKGTEVGQAQVLLLPVAFNLDRIAPDTADAIQAGLERWATIVSERGTAVEAAVAHYNVGRSYGPWSRTAPLAVRHFRAALRADPKYATRPYFWAEIGALLFHTHHYRFAVGAYARALDLGAPPEYRARLADVLMRAGEYDLAQNEFDRYMKEVDKPMPHWTLMAAVLPMIRETVGLSQQTRDSHRALEIVGEGSSGDDPRATANASEAALKADAIFPGAWYNLAGARYEMGDRSGAMESFLAAALLFPEDLEAWANAAALAIGERKAYPGARSYDNGRRISTSRRGLLSSGAGAGEQGHVAGGPYQTRRGFA